MLIAGLVPLALATPARGTVNWTSTFEKGDLSEWGAGINDTKTLADGTVRHNVEVLGEQVHTGKYACKATLHPDDTFGGGQNRIDIQHQTPLTGEGKDLYMSGYYYLPEDAKTLDQFGFYETLGSYINWIDFSIAPKTGGGTTFKLGIESNGGDLGSVPVWSGDFAIGHWHQIALHVHWSQDAQKGSLDFWFDGQQVVTAFKHKTKPNGDNLYYQTGLHRVSVANFTESIYFDDFIEGDSQDDIKIAAPSQPSDGGTDAAVDAGDGGAATTGAGGASSADASGATGAAGDTASGVAGASPTGTAGANGGGGTSGSAGDTSTGTAGTSTDVARGRASSSGCALAPASGAGGGPFPLLLAVVAFRFAWRRRRR